MCVLTVGDEKADGRHEAIRLRFEKLEDSIKDMDQYIMNKAGRVIIILRIWVK